MSIVIFLFALVVGISGFFAAIYGFIASDVFGLTFWKGASFLFGSLSLATTTNQSAISRLPGGLADAFPILRQIKGPTIRAAYILAGVAAVAILGLMATVIVIAPLTGLFIAVLGPIFEWTIDLEKFEEPVERAFWFVWGIGALALCFFSVTKALYGKEFRLF